MSLTEAINYMKAANERNNSDMLDYLDHQAFERREWFKGLPFPSTELAERAYQKARFMTFEVWKAGNK